MDPLPAYSELMRIDSRRENENKTQTANSQDIENEIETISSQETSTLSNINEHNYSRRSSVPLPTYEEALKM